MKPRVVCVLLTVFGAAPAWAQAELTSSPPTLSRITVPVHIPIAAIRNDLQARIQQDQGGTGTGDKVCKSVFGMKICVGTRYDYNIQRTGDVTVEPAPAGLRLGVPIRITGHGGLNGPEAQALHLDARNFRAAANVSVALGLKVKPDWCVETPATVQYSWTEAPRVEIASGTWINIESMVRKQLDARLNASVKKVAASIPCAEMQAALRRVWQIQVLPMKMAGVPNLVLVVDPQTIGISELKASGDGVKVVFAGDALTSLTTTPPASLDKGPLPAPSAVSSDAERASVAVAMNTPYALLRNVGMQAAIRPIPINLGSVSGDVTMTDLVFRQAGRKLAVDISYRLSGLTDGEPQTGVASLEGVPAVAPDGRSVTLNEATIAPGRGTSFDPALTPVLNDTLRQALSRRALVDLGPRLDDVAASLSRLSTDPAKTKGLKLTVHNVQVRLGEITVGPDGLAGTGMAEGDVEADLAALQQP